LPHLRAVGGAEVQGVTARNVQPGSVLYEERITELTGQETDGGDVAGARGAGVQVLVDGGEAAGADAEALRPNGSLGALDHGVVLVGEGAEAGENSCAAVVEYNVPSAGRG